MEKSVTHMATKATNEVKMKELKRIGYLIFLILTLLLTLPAYGEESITNATKKRCLSPFLMSPFLTMDTDFADPLF